MTAEHAVAPEAGRRPRSASARRAALAGLAVLFAVFVGLGTWQVERRAWKLDLIHRVERRVHAAPVTVPEPGLAAERLAADWEYRHVTVTGRYLPNADTFVQAVTDLGAGFWVLTPLQRPDGGVVFVNRGFVTGRPAAATATRSQSVTGLLRLTEPGGGFLRRNDPAADRWYSRDVAVIAATRGLSGAAPYFIDAEAASNAALAPDEPVAGLTVVRFPNSHLVYAVTWFTLAALSVVAAVPVWREGRRPRAAAWTEAGR